MIRGHATTALSSTWRDIPCHDVLHDVAFWVWPAHMVVSAKQTPVAVLGIHDLYGTKNEHTRVSGKMKRSDVEKKVSELVEKGTLEKRFGG